MAMKSGIIDPLFTECSLCTNQFVEPKMLPCGHHFCKDCVIGWVKSKGKLATCPLSLCKAPIVSSERLDPDSLAEQVKAMPTNHGMEVVVKALRVLQTPNVCYRCHNGMEAVFYCFHCEAKICRNCKATHDQTMRNHPMETVDNLNELVFIEQHIIKCEKHPDRQAQYYCLSHQALICDMCTRVDGGSCSDCDIVIQNQTDDHDELKNSMQEMADNLNETADAMACQIEQTTDSFEKTESEINKAFDKMKKRLASQRRSMLADLQEKKMNSTYALSIQEVNQTAMAQNALALQKLVFNASEGCLVRMLRNIKERVMGLHAGFLSSNVANGAVFTVNRRLMARIKADIDRLGRVDTLPISTPETKHLSWMISEGMKQHSIVKPGH